MQSIIADREILLQATAYTLVEILLATSIAVTAGFADRSSDRHGASAATHDLPLF